MAWKTVPSHPWWAESGVSLYFLSFPLSEEARACVLEIDPKQGMRTRIFAAGLRNPVGMAVSSTGDIWTVVNERDLLGDDLVPDYATRVREGAHYGWPWTYWGVVDTRVSAPQPPGLPSPTKPDFALGSHTASLGIVFHNTTHLGYGALIAQHGSWNRRQPSGYKVIFVPFDAATGLPTRDAPTDFLTGFLADDESNLVYGRPVGVAVDRDGSIFVSDDTGGTIWRVKEQ